MKNNGLSCPQRIALEALWGVSKLFAMMPYWFKYYLFEGFIFFLLFHVLRYRMKVVMGNLRRSFPDKSERELRRIRRNFYVTLSEIIVDTINLAHQNTRKMRRLISVENLEEHRRAVRDRDWIALTAHFGCWEYCSYWGVYEEAHATVAVYHPLHSKVMEHFFRRLRSVRNSIPVPMKECLRFYLRNREHGIQGRHLVLGLIADQNPPLRPDSHWFRFLNQDTVFFDGGEKLALKCHLPVYFARMERLARGRYRIRFEQIYDGEEQVAPNEITERYVRKLEEMICERPELWLWSHRRWKYRRSDAAR